MTDIDRRQFLRGLGAAVALAPGVGLRPVDAAQAAGANRHLTHVNPEFLVTPAEARKWHAAKDSMGGPTIAGSPSWRNFLAILERELRASGVVDIFRNPWTYRRWYTSEWPDDSNWSLHIDGVKTKVASYGCNSGTTPGQGVSGQLVVYEPGMPADRLRGKIAIVRRLAGGAAGGAAITGDYEYLSSAESFPNPLVPSSQALNPFPRMGLGDAQKPLIDGGAIGALIDLGLSYEALAGIYTFGVPALHDLPTLYIDRDVAAQAIAAAKREQPARLRLISKTEESETYQLFGYLPGRNYGSAADEQVLLVTHTDGPSISQENGAFGIAGIVKYFSSIPRAERPRTLMVFLDCRHYMPGAERAFAQQDYAATHPDLYKKVIAAMGIEHLGQIQPEEGPGRPYGKSSLTELSSVWATNNQRLIDLAIKAVKDNKLRRAQVQSPGRPGIHGGDQGPWYGMGGIARRIGVPGLSTMGLMSAYWSTKARLDWLDERHFVDQVATMSQLCGELMVASIGDIQAPRTQAVP